MPDKQKHNCEFEKRSFGSWGGGEGAVSGTISGCMSCTEPKGPQMQTDRIKTEKESCPYSNLTPQTLML